ncbi:MAG: DUF6777 domain-containing protein [Capsulimonadales bacterium]|nr:DUF6777 domain-containing protein [Capsulimonadales bacterium]
MKWKIEPGRARFVFVLTLLTAALIEGTGLAQQRDRPLRAAARRPSMIDAFLDRPVDSTDELVAVLRKDLRLRRRYARHFNLPEDRIVDFVRNALIVDYLKRDRVVTNYCVTGNGRIYPLRQVFKKGTKVWALRDGTPVLRWACANPLTKRLPMTLTSRRPTLSPIPEVGGRRPQIVETVPPPRLPEVAAATPTLPPNEPLEASTENLLSGPDLVGSSVVIVGGTPFPSRLPLAPLTLITLPIIGNLPHSGSGATPVIPEPGGIWLLLTGIPFLLARRR